MLRTANRQAFTLIELLVALTIITIVLGIALPVFSHAKDTANESFDLNHTRQTAVALHAFAADHHGRLPGLENLDGVNRNPGINMMGSQGTWIDVLLNQGYATSPMMFTDCTIDTSGGDGTYGNSIGLIRYHFAKRASASNLWSDSAIDQAPPARKASAFSPYTWKDRGVRTVADFGPSIEGMANPSKKFMAAEAVEGSAWAGLSAWRGTANIRHANNSGHYAYYDGHVAALSFQDVFGAAYDDNAAPIGPAPADNWLYNLRHLGMTGGFNNKQYGHHYTSAEVFPAWAPWVP